MIRYSVCLILAMTILWSCRTGTGLFGKKTPHEQYGDKLSSAGLKETALGRAWFTAAEQSLNSPLIITLPYKETGYFAADKPQAAGLRFQAKRGEKLSISLSKKPASGFAVYMELWKAPEAAGAKPKLQAVADTNTFAIEHEVDDAATYIIRVQPELLKSGEYTLSISMGPSLAYPIRAPGKNHIQSYWGDSRDAGGRSHEGIDMFAPKRSPAIAAANGRVTRVNENNLGGKVVWMRPDNKNYILYYAHLDTQLVTDGQAVKVGDTLGLIGNTGNARNTLPHLHFGIYGSGGAIDPFPFVNPDVKIPADITAPAANVGKYLRAEGRQARMYAGMNEQPMTLQQDILLQVEAATADWYKIRLPDGRLGLIKSNQADGLTELRKLSWKEDRFVYDLPDSLAARKTTIKAGNAVSVLAAFSDYYYIRTQADVTGWVER